MRKADKPNGISIGRGCLWVLIWFGCMLLYTALDVVIWRKAAPFYAKYLNLFSIIFCMVVYLIFLIRKNHFQVSLLENISVQAILLALGCAILFYFILDKGLDPIFESIFQASEESYQEMLQSLGAAPIVSFLHVCILAPMIEEILMRGFLLGGLLQNYGKRAALLVSAFLFALLHFNMVQTLSAFICGIVLGLLYLYTGSLFSCILAHAGYNAISYITMILPLYSS